MLENLFNLIREQGTDSVISNPDIPNEQNEAVLADATHSVAEEFQQVLAGGGTENIMSLFQGNGNSPLQAGGLLDNPIVGNIINSFKNKLTQNHGISDDKADGIAGNLIPNVISSLINKTNDPNNNSFDLKNIIGTLMSGNNRGGLDIKRIISGFTQGGLDANGDGKIGLDDIISKVTGGGGQQQSVQPGGGSILDTIKGFMK
ncbi:hypothetical protein BH11BAC3_BH11BAC3_14650 [soil metagenome]